MKKWIHRAKKKLRSVSGETITESIVSILIFTLLMLAVTAMVQSAVKITSSAAQNAKKAQEDEINPLVLAVSGSEAYVTFTCDAAGIYARHIVTVHSEDGLIAFEPKGASGP